MTVLALEYSNECNDLGSQSVSTKEEGIMLPEEQRKAFGAFYRSARHNDILDEKTTVMIHLATAMSVACYP